MKETILDLFELKEKNNALTLEDIEFAYKMGVYDGKIEMLTERLQNQNKEKAEGE